MLINLARGGHRKLKIRSARSYVTKPNLPAAAAIAARGGRGVKLADVELHGAKPLLFHPRIGIACEAEIRKTQEALHVGFARILIIYVVGVLPKIAG